MSSSSEDATIQLILLAALFSLFGVGWLASFPLYNSSIDTVTTTLNSKERVCHSDKCKYMLYTDAEVLENTDSLRYGKWDSSDLYGDLEAGKTYQFKVVGWRMPVLSWHRNVLEVTDVAAPSADL